jgi:glutamate-1-semialdehyde aminotransferase
MSYLASHGTLSKAPSAWGLPDDTAIIEAQGCKYKLNDGKWYTSWTSGLGSNLYGYAHPDFTNHVSKQLSLTGGSLSLPSCLESQVAEKLCLMLGLHVPNWTPDHISARFAKTGSDVTTMAVRLARAVTQRPYILTFAGGYHGWGADFISRTDPAWGILPFIPNGGHTSGKWQQAETYERKVYYGVREVEPNFDLGGWLRWDEIAAIIFEQGVADPQPGWYAYLRKLCNQTGTLLIADEVVTGLRYGLGGACERYGIEPDLICMGKGLGNGLPISALIGRRDYMDWFNRVDPVFASSTVWGESVGLAAAEYVLDNWTQDKVDYLWHIGGHLMEGSVWPVVGHPPRSLFSFEDEVSRAFFIQGMKARGILCNRPNFPTPAHGKEEAEATLKAIEEVKVLYEATEPGERETMMAGCLPRILFKER